MKRKCVVWDFLFVPTPEFKEFIENLGYKFTATSEVSEVNFDLRVIKYVEDHADWKHHGSPNPAMKGAPSSRFKIGFAGAATIIEVDPTRPWIIKYTNCDAPYPAYITVETNKFGQCTVLSSKE